METIVIEFKSRFALNEDVSLFEKQGFVTKVSFSDGKVTYDIQLHEGGEEMRNIDSAFVEP